MRLTKVLVLTLLCLAGAIPAAQAQQQSNTAGQIHIEGNFAAVPALIAAGVATWDITYPSEINGPGTYTLAITVHTTVAAAAALTVAIGTAIIASPGCSVTTGGGVLDAQATATAVVGYVPLVVASGTNYCHFSLRLNLQVGVLMTNVDFVRVDFVTRTERPYAYLCDAPGITPDAFTGATTCNDPSVNVPDVAASITDFTDTLCRPVGNHGHCELDIHGEIGVDILNDATDDGMLTVPPASISNVSVNGTFPSELTVHADFPGDGENLGLDAWTTALFWIAAVLFFAFMGWLVALGFAIPGLIAAMVPSVKTILDGLGLDFEALFMLCLLGFILEIVANRGTWGGYQSGKRRLRFGA